MLAAEKTQLLAFFDRAASWCQNAEARDGNGVAVQYDDPAAVAWDLTGALCRLFGWRRTGVLFAQLERHITGKKAPYRYDSDPVISSMLVLQRHNDDPDVVFDTIREELESMPVWTGAARTYNSGNEPKPEEAMGVVLSGKETSEQPVRRPIQK